MSISQDTDRTKAIVIKNISHRWLKWLDWFIGMKKAETGGYFTLSLPFRGGDAPVLTHADADYKTYKLND